PETFGALKRSAFGSPERREQSIKDELRANLLTRLATRKPIFHGVVGYEETVMPQIVNALLSRHNFILLGLRGQAKSRILRALTTHYGMLPRANRGIFALNELPDLAGKVQVSLFNIMQEGDVQIKGYPVRLPLDVMLCFTANPEDYTARGKIITPLKDRIGSEV